MQFNLRLKQLRIEAGLTQVEVVRRIGCARQTYLDFEKGKTSPKVETLIKIADALKVSVSELVSVPDYTEPERTTYMRKIGKLSDEKLEAICMLLNL